MMNRRGWIVIVALFSFFFLTQRGRGQHRHPPQDVAIHEQFYKTWMMPNAPHVSCCDLGDCYPTEARFENGSWYARRREDGAWLKVPAEKVEQNRDNPDGRNHLCAPRPERAITSEVYCFTAGTGI